MTGSAKGASAPFNVTVNSNQPFGGSYADEITGMVVGPTGEIFVSGYADSNDLPALAGTPDACRPSPNQVLGFVTRLAPDGVTAGPTQLVRGVPQCLYFSCASVLYNDFHNYPDRGPLAIRSDGTLLFAGTHAPSRQSILRPAAG